MPESSRSRATKCAEAIASSMEGSRTCNSAGLTSIASDANTFSDGLSSYSVMNAYNYLQNERDGPNLMATDKGSPSRAKRGQWCLLLGIVQLGTLVWRNGRTKPSHCICRSLIGICETKRGEDPKLKEPSGIMTWNGFQRQLKAKGVVG
jgi:hypothetical protein